MSLGSYRCCRFYQQEPPPPWPQRWVANDADSLTGPRWDGQIAPAASAAPPLGPWTLGGRSGPSGPARSSGPQTSRSLCPGPCRRSHRPRLQFQPVSRRGCWCPGPWPRPNRLQDKQVVEGATQSMTQIVLGPWRENRIFPGNKTHKGTQHGPRTIAVMYLIITYKVSNNEWVDTSRNIKPHFKTNYNRRHRSQQTDAMSSPQPMFISSF